VVTADSSSTPAQPRRSWDCTRCCCASMPQRHLGLMGVEDGDETRGLLGMMADVHL
jgi:hypothetical protein